MRTSALPVRKGYRPKQSVARPFRGVLRRPSHSVQALVRHESVRLAPNLSKLTYPSSVSHPCRRPSTILHSRMCPRRHRPRLAGLGSMRRHRPAVSLVTNLRDCPWRRCQAQKQHPPRRACRMQCCRRAYLCTGHRSTGATNPSSFSDDCPAPPLHLPRAPPTLRPRRQRRQLWRRKAVGAATWRALHGMQDLRVRAWCKMSGQVQQRRGNHPRWTLNQRSLAPKPTCGSCPQRPPQSQGRGDSARHRRHRSR